MKRIPFFKDVGHLSGVLLLPCFNDKFGINTFFSNFAIFKNFSLSDSIAHLRCPTSAVF